MNINGITNVLNVSTEFSILFLFGNKNVQNCYQNTYRNAPKVKALHRPMTDECRTVKLSALCLTLENIICDTILNIFAFVLKLNKSNMWTKCSLFLLLLACSFVLLLFIRPYKANQSAFENGRMKCEIMRKSLQFLQSH